MKSLRTKLLTISCSVGAGALGLLSVGCTQSTEKAPQKPNILFLFADDQRADALGCSENTYIKTPNIDRIAVAGVHFTNSYYMGGNTPAVCAPSRAMLNSGKSLFHICNNIPLEGVTTMPEYFRSHGYVTFGTGKWHNGAKSFERSFDDGKNVLIGGMSDHFKVPCRDMESNHKLGKVEIKGYSTDVFSKAATDFLKSYASGNREKPFYCYLAFTAPHDPRSPREDYVGKYPDGTLPLPGNFEKYHPFAFDNMTIRDENLAPWPRTPEMIQKSLSDYYAMISLVDKKVGDIIQLLKENGLYDNTIIVYAADNGLSIGSHGLLGKQNLYEECVKIPLIMAGPGINKGQVSKAFVYLYDIFPTICNLSGLPAPPGVDGKDISPILKGESEGVRTSVFTAYRNTVRAIREGNWKMIRYPDRDITQLYDLASDPLEINNLANDPEYQDKLAELTALMKKKQTETGDTISLTAKHILPSEYDPTKFVQKPDKWQPEYTLKRYFKNTDLKKAEK